MITIDAINGRADLDVNGKAGGDEQLEQETKTTLQKEIAKPLATMLKPILTDMANGNNSTGQIENFREALSKLEKIERSGDKRSGGAQMKKPKKETIA
jgi:hypothetical protein